MSPRSPDYNNNETLKEREQQQVGGLVVRRQLAWRHERRHPLQTIDS